MLFRWLDSRSLRLCRRFSAQLTAAAEPRFIGGHRPEKHSFSANRAAKPQGRKPILFLALCLSVFAANFSCGSKPTDLRTRVPADTLVYLETNDLAAALQPIVDSKPFNEVAKSKPDFSALKGVQLAIAITGFESKEEKLTDEHSIGRIQPHFVAIADTHAWNYQALGFAEQKLGAFVEKIYDSPPMLEKSDKKGGKYFTWTAKDGRKAYALVIDGIIYFGNDESSIDKCLAVKRGEIDSLVKTGKVLPADRTTLSSGYISTDGIAQIANIIGLKFASEAREDSEVQSAIAGILPQLLRNSVTDLSWTATKTDQGIEDKYLATMPPELATVFNETMASTGAGDNVFALTLNSDVRSATKYDLRNPLRAWESVVQLTKKAGGPLAPQIVDSIAPSFFEPYGIKNDKLFLQSAGPVIITQAGGSEDEKHAVYTQFRNIDDLRKSIIGPLKKQRAEVGDGVMEVFASNDDEFAAQFYDTSAMFGDRELLVRNDRDAWSLKDKLSSISSSRDPPSMQTVSNVPTAAADICALLSDCNLRKQTNAISIMETRFTKIGIERRTVSDFGLIGLIIAQLAQD